jgi:hypothetical protein
LTILDIEKSPFSNHTAMIKDVIQEVCFGDMKTKSIESEIVMVPNLLLPLGGITPPNEESYATSENQQGSKKVHFSIASQESLSNRKESVKSQKESLTETERKSRTTQNIQELSL